MSKNIRHDLRQVIIANFKERSQKKEVRELDPELAKSKIFSYGTKNQLLDRVNDFCKFLPPDIKKFDQLTPKIVREYLETKMETCTQNTINEYRSEMVKIGRLINKDLRCEKVTSVKPYKEGLRGSKAVISRGDFAKILDYADKHPSQSGACIRLESLIGVRVSDLCYGIEIKPDHLHIRCKNGKWLNRFITPEIRSILNSDDFKQMIRFMPDGGVKVVAPKDNSINKYLNRLQDRLGLERHSFHDIRRRIAQDKYDEYRHTGLSRQETLSSVSVWLNHGKDRDVAMLLRSYIANAW